jgi:hypothetical protein
MYCARCGCWPVCAALLLACGAGGGVLAQDEFWVQISALPGVRIVDNDPVLDADPRLGRIRFNQASDQPAGEWEDDYWIRGTLEYQSGDHYRSLVLTDFMANHLSLVPQIVFDELTMYWDYETLGDAFNPKVWTYGQSDIDGVYIDSLGGNIYTADVRVDTVIYGHDQHLMRLDPPGGGGGQSPQPFADHAEYQTWDSSERLWSRMYFDLGPAGHGGDVIRLPDSLNTAVSTDPDFAYPVANPANMTDMLGRRASTVTGNHFAFGGSLTKTVSTLAETMCCDGSMDIDLSGPVTTLEWEKDVGVVTQNDWVASFACSECAGCEASASARIFQNVQANPNGAWVEELAFVYARAEVGDTVPEGVCSAYAEADETLTMDAWAIGESFSMTCQLNFGDELILEADDGEARLEWRSTSTVVGLEDLWELTIIADDVLTVHFASDPALGLDDDEIEAIIGSTFEQEGEGWWLTQRIAFGPVEFTVWQAHWELFTHLDVFAAAACIPEPATLSILMIGALGLLRRRTG